MTKVTLPTYPSFGKLANWIDRVVSGINDASGRGDDACVKWLNRVIEQDSTLLELKEVPKEWWWLDRRISEAMQVRIATAAKKKNQHAISLQ